MVDDGRFLTTSLLFLGDFDGHIPECQATRTPPGISPPPASCCLTDAPFSPRSMTRALGSLCLENAGHLDAMENDGNLEHGNCMKL